MKKLTAVSVLALCWIGAVAGEEMATPESQGVSSKAILSFVEACEKAFDGGPAGAVHGFVIRRHGKVIAEGTWAPDNTLERPHMLYSHSKSFTSTAIGFLVDDGKLDLDERVADIFADKMPTNPSPKMREVRVRDLLTMNVGADYTDAERRDPTGDWVKAFLANAVERDPGTGFKYDSAATFMLSAIVRRRTGKDLMEFLGERLFAPLGITGAWSGTSPDGTACGGWGMNMTTRDLAKFGQLYLNRGVWEGKRLLSEEWVALATARQTWSGPIGVTGEDGSDWHCGYGFQFWRCRHGGFRADGASGQLTVVLPDEDAVVSVHAGLGDMQKEVNLIWDHLLPGMNRAALPEDPAAQAALKTKLASLVIPVIPAADATGAFLPAVGKAEKTGPFDFKAPRVEKTDEGWALVEEGRRLAVGSGAWAMTRWKFSDSAVEPLFALTKTRDIAASGAWTAPDTLTVKWMMPGGIRRGTFCVRVPTDTIALTDWQFSRDGVTWEKVAVPHDWAIKGPFDKEIDKQVVRIVENQEVKATEKTGRTGALPWTGRGEYRRTIEIPAGAEWASLVFSGAMSEPEVYLDGAKVGEWKYGYTPFEVELPVASGRHEVVVKLNNREKSSRWYPGAGLYRPVTLRWGKSVGIKTWGQAIHTPDLETVVVKTELRNPQKAEAAVSYRVLDAKGREVASGASPLKVPGAHPWSPESPYLYTLETTVKVSGKVVDARRERFGLRTVEYGKGWFKLNGVKRKFRGVCLHHDLGPLGAAFDGDAFRRQVLILKEMGCDSIRTSHNIPPPEQLAICDDLGMMVMAESFDAWERAKVANGYNLWFKEWWRRDLTQLVLTARNHPSVVMWSIGNEVPDQQIARGAELTREMQDFIHTLDPDPKRLVTQGASDMPAAIKSGVIGAMEIPAVTYRLPFYEAIHAASPEQGMVLGVETASTVSSRGVYKFPDEPKTMANYADGQCSGYDTEYCLWSNLPDDDWAMQDDREWTIGEFVWTGFDYLGEPTPYDRYWPSRSSYFGIFDLAGLPKDRYWLYRSRWNTASHTLHLVPHWTFPGREGQVTPVSCYTDFAEAELFVNGRSQGRRRKDPSSRLDRYRLRWRDVVYEPGELKVVAYDAQGAVAMTETVRTAGAFARFEEKAMDVGRLRFVTVTAVDAKGTTCPEYDGTYEVKPPKGWRFKAICNGDATSLELFVRSRMKLFKGQLVYVLERSL